ncbi:HNH endonuclease [Chitinibacter fontanus]|uniref:HNH endonuclease n=1 Tax=Chitinibacter fontanus TaxID=1737446 RepID=A0A7D5V8N3_9NEIS|nr:HNH endonuclease domain-containing protein [Chitinibacter fontanus]QLI80855.1 HNH endonuclease [Chitinibacter fontanus]
MTSIPTAQQQLDFIAKIQRLFAEGDFSATYKYALLIALTEIAVESDVQDGRELVVSNRLIADKFIELYWKQTTPYTSGLPETIPGVLAQNHGVQAAIVNAISEFRSTYSMGINTLNAAKAHEAYRSLQGKVATVVSAQPLNYLQNYGGATHAFIYARDKGQILLLPGVVYCLRAFQGLIQQLARARWVEYVKSHKDNRSIVGQAGDLESFMFETSRANLMILGKLLRKLDGHHCFYCGVVMQSTDVDHFIPFSAYPRDLGDNFVLAHASCNRSKSDNLASLTHLENWLERKQQKQDDLQSIASEAGFIFDSQASKSVAHWAYSSALNAQGSAWVRSQSYDLISPRYLTAIER